MNSYDVEKNVETDKFFPYVNMTAEERNYYLNIIKNCKDICNSENKIDNQSKCELVELKLVKENRIIVFNGSVAIGKENRSIRGEIYLKKNQIIVDMHVTRLLANDEKKVYTVLDEFKLENDILKRRSMYNYDMKNIYNEIKDEELKERIR